MMKQKTVAEKTKEPSLCLKEPSLCLVPVSAVSNWFEWEKDPKEIPKIHPAQKPVNVLEKLIATFTDPGDVVIDPCCGSGTTLRAARNLGRSAYGFEIDRDFYRRAHDEMLGLTEE